MTKILPVVFATIAAIALFFLVAVAVNALLSLLTMLLWNLFVPPVLSGPYIAFWPAFGLTGLIRLIGLSFRGNATIAPVHKEGHALGK